MSSAALYPGAFTNDSIQKLLAAQLVTIAASGAVDPHTSNRYMITKGGVAALTLAAPTAGVDDGRLIEIISNTAYAHTLTSTGNFQDGAGHVNEATFAADAGASILLVAYQGKWNVLRIQGVTMS
jgi:hypothetical protein